MWLRCWQLRTTQYGLEPAQLCTVLPWEIRTSLPVTTCCYAWHCLYVVIISCCMVKRKWTLILWNNRQTLHNWLKASFWLDTPRSIQVWLVQDTRFASVASQGLTPWEKEENVGQLLLLVGWNLETLRLNERCWDVETFEHIPLRFLLQERTHSWDQEK